MQMSYEAVDCVDAGTDYCPCYLAKTNNCLICSQLQGKLFCDCINWKGVCIYQEYVWNAEKRKDARDNTTARILEKKKINDKTIYLKIKVTRTLARELNQPGSYIFIRDENSPEFFNTPMSIMCSNELDENVELMLQLLGVKTRTLENIGDSLLIRGPYWNGILGLKSLKAVKDSNCLIVVRGIAQAPSVLVAKKLKFSNNNVFVILDGGSTETTFTKKYFNELGCSIYETSMMEGKTFNYDGGRIIKNIIQKEDIKLVFSGGTDIIHKNIYRILETVDKNILFACTNNANICCGEGVCGSCSIRLQDGRRVKACKSQVDPAGIVGGKL